MPKRTTKKKPEANVDAMDFETAMGQLESIIEAIETGEIGLEQSLTEYEQGVRLISRCRSILSHVEQRVETLRDLDHASDTTESEDDAT